MNGPKVASTDNQRAPSDAPGSSSTNNANAIHFIIHGPRATCCAIALPLMRRVMPKCIVRLIIFNLNVHHNSNVHIQVSIKRTRCKYCLPSCTDIRYVSRSYANVYNLRNTTFNITPM